MNEIILEISPEKAVKLIDKISRFIVEKRMAAPAIMTIESLRPLHNIGSQLMHFLAPFAEVFVDSREYQEFAALLEHDKYISMLVKRIDELDDESYSQERAEKRVLRKRRHNKIKKFFGIKPKADKKKSKK
ncbi:MAG: hypothetical protein R6U84_08285 [Candidatus Cloacimonadales bacterium]